MGGRDQTRTYSRKDSVVFRKTDEPFGGLSNMAGGYPIRVNGVRILTSEALYQVCRFPHLPDVQKMIIGQISPMTAKMRSKPYRKDSRADWDHVRVRIMRWCLRMKLANNWNSFSELLLRTGERPIVEESRKDDFWGAKAVDDGNTLVGMNVLGRLLMELREQVKQQGRDAALDVAPPDIAQFLLFGQPIEVAGAASPPPQVADAQEQGSLFGADSAISVEVSISPVAAATSAYPTYRTSEAPWVERIPAHWRTARLRYVARVGNGTTPSRDRFDYWSNGTVPWLASGQVNDYIVRKARELVTPQAVKESSLRVLPAGSVILGMVGQGKTRGMSAYLAIDATINQNLAGITPGKELDGRYLHYMLTAAYDFQRNYGRGGNQAALNCAIVGSFPTLLPPRPEQDQIVAYLRAQDAHVARFINAKRDLIGLLTEQKLRIIDHAVTRGLDASVKLKPFCVEWLGEVPEHWELRRLKFLASNVTNQTTTKAIDEIYLALEHVQSWTGVARPLEGEAEFASTVKRFVADDVLFGKLRPYLAKVTRMVRAGVCVSEFLVLRSRQEFVLPAYLEQLLRCKRVIDLINSSTAGAKMPRADWSFIGNVRLALPRKDEQEAILSHIWRETKDLDEAIARAEDEIKLILEYRDRLIFDAVTGQVDLRGWQPGPADAVSDDDLTALGDDEAEPVEETADGDG